MSFMALAVLSQPSAIEMPGTAVRDGVGLAAVCGARLGIEGLELAGAAGHPEQDARHLPLAEIVGVKGHPVGEADGDAGRDGHARCPQADCLEEMAAADDPRAAHRHVNSFFFQGHGRFPFGSLSAGSGTRWS